MTAATRLSAGKEAPGCVKTPAKVFVTHTELIFPRQQAFPLLQSATGVHTNNDKKCLW